MDTPSKTKIKVWVMEDNQAAFIGMCELVVQPDNTLHLVLEPEGVQQLREILEPYDPSEETEIEPN